MPERRDSFHKVILVLEGVVAFQERGRPERRGLGRGSCMIIPAGTWHVLRDERPATLLVLGIDKTFIQKDADLAAAWKLLLKAGPIQVQAHWPGRRLFDSLWRRALLEASRRRVGDACVLKSIAVEILVSLVRYHEERVSGPDAKARVSALISELGQSFPEPWTLDSAAARCALSRRRFSSLHRELTGISFLQRLTELRAAHAARLLECGEATVLGAMFASGFNDLSHFYRIFRRRYGVAPGRWAE